MGDEHHNWNLPPIPSRGKEVCQYCIDAAMDGKVGEASYPLGVLPGADGICLKEEISNDNVMDIVRITALNTFIKEYCL